MQKRKDVLISKKEVNRSLGLFKASLFKTSFIPELFPRTSYQAPRTLRFTSEKSTGNICGLQLTQLMAFPQLLHHQRTQANTCCKDVLAVGKTFIIMENCPTLKHSAMKKDNST